MGGKHGPALLVCGAEPEDVSRGRIPGTLPGLARHPDSGAKREMGVMCSWIQFATFDPKSGYVPAHPFSILPAIAQRARWLLRSRTEDQIYSAAEGIAWAIDEYFRNAREEEIARLRDELDQPRNWRRMSPSDEHYYNDVQKFFEWDGGSRANGRWLFNDAMEGEL